MKKLFSLLFVAMTMVSLAHATTFTFTDTISQTKDGITVRFGKGTGQSAPAYTSEQMRVYTGNTITVSGGTITSVAIEFTKRGTKAYIPTLTASTGTVVSGGASTSENDVKTDTWTGSASKVVFALEGSGQRVVKSITVVGTGGTTGGDEGGDEGGDGGDESGLNDAYVYSEPTVVENHDSIGSNMAYSFIQNNIKVNCTKGARTGSYFSCNAGSSITFTATKNIKGVVINGYVKKDFEATASAGDIDFVDASEAEVTADPVVVVYDIDAKTVTLDCVKQMRCYSVEFYFDANPDAEIGGGSGEGGDEGDYNFDYEPATQSTFNINFGDSTYVEDMTSDFGVIDLYMWNDDYDAELYFIVDAADANTVIPVGTYSISGSEAANTVLASPGGDEMYDYPSVMMTGYEYNPDWGEWYYTETYYLASGTVTVAQNGKTVTVTINAVSHFGSTLNLSCQYEAEESTGLRDAVRMNDASKLMRNGRLLIRRNGKTFNAQGAAL